MTDINTRPLPEANDVYEVFAEQLEVADKQLTSEEQGKAYPSMRTIREFEERVHKGFPIG